MNGGGALWSISRLADCVPSVVYKSTLPRVLVAKRDLDSQCIRRWKSAFTVLVSCVVLHFPMVTGVYRIGVECPTASADGNKRLPYCAVCPTASADGNKRLPYCAVRPTASADGNRRLPYCAVRPTAFSDGDRCFVCHLVLQSTYSRRRCRPSFFYTYMVNKK